MGDVVTGVKVLWLLRKTKKGFLLWLSRYYVNFFWGETVHMHTHDWEFFKKSVLIKFEWEMW